MFKYILFLFSLTLMAQASVNSVLLLHSYNRGLQWSDDISKGVESILSKHSNIELTTEYMDRKKNISAPYKALTYQLFAQKLKHRQYDVIIAADNFAVDFVLQYQKSLFKSSHIIFCGLDTDFPGINIQKALDSNINIVLENKQINTNIDLILKIIPTIEQIYIVNGPTPSSQLVNKKIKRTIEEYKNIIPIRLHSSGNLSQISSEISNLPKNSAVLFGSLYTDSTNRYVSPFKIKELISSVKVPVFSLMDYYLNQGIIGGVLTRGIYQGEESAKLAINYLTNQPINYKRPINTRADLIFDYNSLQRFNIDTNTLPSNAQIINKPLSFFEKHAILVNRVFIAFPFVLLFLIIAIFNIYKRHKVERQLIAQSYLEQVLLNNIYSSIFWTNHEGIIVGCNKSFCDFLQLCQCKDSSCEKNICNSKNLNNCFIIGKRIQELFNLANIPLKSEDLLSHTTFEIAITNKTYLIRNKSYLNENKENEGIITIITDISEKKELEVNKQFIIQQSKLSEIGEMLSSIVHQWKVPLVELSAVAHKMQFYHQKNRLSEKEINSFFETIMTQIVYMSDTIDDFRSFIKPSSKPISFNINLAIKEIISIASFSLEHNHISISFTNHMDEEKDLFGYPNEFKQVLLNIINNAKDAILHQRQLELCQGEIHIELLEETNCFELRIKDDGTGIESSIEDKIFNSFFTSKPNGDGIGLYMAKLIIEKKMHGNIQAHNHKSGAEFIISLPKIFRSEF